MDPELNTPEQLLDWAKSTNKRLGDNKEAQERAAAEFSARFQRIEERAAFATTRETAPEGGDAMLIERCMGKDGLRLRAQRTNEEFAGQQVQVERSGLFDTAPTSEWHADLLRLGLAATFLRNSNRSATNITRELLAHAAKAPVAGGIRAALEKSIMKSVSDTATSGGEWAPDVPLSALYQEFYIPSGLAEAFETVNVRGPISIPKLTTNLRPRLKGKVTTNNPGQYTASEVVTDAQVIDPVGFAVRSVVDDALVEDAIVPVLPTIMMEIARALKDGYEDAMLNGDTAATHQDAIATWNLRSRWGTTDLGGTDDHRRAFIGLRPIAYDRSNTVDLAASQTMAGIMGSVIGPMGERAGGDIVIICSPEVMYQKLVIDTNVLTLDKFGPKATIFTGQVGAVGGHPIVMSRFMGADLAASGLYTGSGSKSGLLAVDRSAWKHYQVRAALVESQKDITIGAFNVVATLRRTFRTLSGSAQPVSYFAFNML